MRNSDPLVSILINNYNKDKFEIIDNFKSFRTPIKYSKDEISSVNNILSKKVLTIFE